MGWLDGKRALVAGAGSGIGRAVLAAFVSEGARVGARERDEAKAARLAAELPDCVTARGDATVMADARAAVEAVTSSFGGLDVLVNCVGIFDFYRGLADLADDQLDAAFDEMFAVNVKSQLVTVRAALPELRRAGGSVVLTVSTSGFYPGRGGVLYVASKFAVRGCVIALAHELAPEVRVNGVAPGGTLGTELTGPASLGLADRVLDAAEGREEDLRRRTPLRVALSGADHAGSYVFLASDRARGITGTSDPGDAGKIGRAVLADLLPARRPRYSARKVKCSTSRYHLRDQDRDQDRPCQSVTISRVQITIRVPPPDRPAARPRRASQPPPAGPRPPLPDSRRDQVTRIMASQPAQDWSGGELASRLGVKPPNLLTQLAEWTRLGFLSKTGRGRYALPGPAGPAVTATNGAGP